VKARPALINQYDTEGHTPLSLAIKTNRRDVSFSLMSKGASPDIFDESTGRTPLYYSVFYGYLKISKDIIAAGGSIDLGDFNKITPLMLACKANDVRHLKLLKNEGALLNLQDYSGWTACHYAGHFIVGLFCYISSFLLFVWLISFTYALLATVYVSHVEDKFFTPRL
jgi:ankyrin repeat protein